MNVGGRDLLNVKKSLDNLDLYPDLLKLTVE